MNTDANPTVPEVVAKLQALGSARQIAQFLAAEGVNGHSREPESCPVATYLRRETGCSDALVDHFWVSYGSDMATRLDQIHWLEIAGTPVGEFVFDFDRGLFPALNEERV